MAEPLAIATAAIDGDAARAVSLLVNHLINSSVAIVAYFK